MLQDRPMMYARYQSGAMIEVENTVNGKTNVNRPHPLPTRPVRPFHSRKVVHNATAMLFYYSYVFILKYCHILLAYLFQYLIFCTANVYIIYIFIILCTYITMRFKYYVLMHPPKC